MSEPPTLPDSSGSDEPVNPFEAPAHVPVSPYAGDVAPAEGTASYGPIFWSSLLIMGFLLLCMTIEAWPLGVYFGWIYLLGLIRVPVVLNRRIKYGNPQRLGLNAVPVLWVSWVLVLAMTFAAGTAFVLVCTPGTLLGLDFIQKSASQGDNYMFFIFGLSGFVALFVFGLLYRLSLKY